MLSVFVLIISLISLTLISASLLFVNNTTPAQAAGILDSDLQVNVDSVLELSLSTCNSSDNSQVAVNVEPSIAGTFKSNCQDVFVNTNAPGYSLSAKANGLKPSNYSGVATTNAMLYQNPTLTTPTPTIPATSNTISSPNTLSTDTWGFAAENRLNFDSTYTIDNASNTYAALPTTDTTIYHTTTFPLPETSHKFFYAAKLTPATMAGSYATTVTYTAVGEELKDPPKNCENSGKAPECIKFTIDVGNTGTYIIPTNSQVGGYYVEHKYDWDVFVDGLPVADCPNGNCLGAGLAPNSNDGITLTNLADGQHSIQIVPHDEPFPGWGNAFGHNYQAGGSDSQENRNKLIALDAPLTTMAFAPKTTENAVNASFMFAGLFNGCKNLTTTATFLNTHRLSDIEHMDGFLTDIHSAENSNLVNPVDLAPLSDLLNKNNTVTSLSGFLNGVHRQNDSLTNPIDLSPLSNWFSANTSITYMNQFISGTHSSNSSLEYPINLSPLSGWFSANNSIEDLSNFLGEVHGRNSQLTNPIDLSPLSGWFDANDSIVWMDGFLSYAHIDNHQLTTPVDLSPLSGWFYNNGSIESLGWFLEGTHDSNYELTTPVDLIPLYRWFNSHNAIDNLSSFFVSTHANNTSLTFPVDFTPLREWFDDHASISGLYDFLNSTHMNNASFKLHGKQLFPNWFKTIKQDATNIWNVAGAFQSTFRVEPYEEFHGDTDEVKFMDDTVLSSVGQPTDNKETYTGRMDIVPVNSNWQL